MSTQYKVYFTPRDSRTTYDDEVEVSNYVRLDGLPKIKRSIDATDFEFGVYSYDDVTIRLVNVDGKFNDEFDVRSMFPFGRDRTKVRVEFSNSDGDTIKFRGYINEEATKADPDDDLIEFRVLSRDSVLRTTNVTSGGASVGETLTEVLFNVLNQSDVTEFLNVDQSNINPDFGDVEIDSTEDLTDQSVRDIVNRILLACNSVLIVDEDDNVIVRSRDANTDTDVLSLYGPFDIKGRCNVLKVDNYNSGRHRAFTSVMINDTEYNDQGFALDYGYRQKAISLSFITDQSKETQIAQRLVDSFKTPKIEMEVTVPCYIARDANLLDRVSVAYPLRLKPRPGKFMPIVGVTRIDDADMPLPDQYGSLEISPNTAFKIIGIEENPKDFTIRLKLRQTGIDTNDGLFSLPGSCIIGYAVIGDAVICSGGSDCDTFLNAHVGAGKIGCTQVA